MFGFYTKNKLRVIKEDDVYKVEKRWYFMWGRIQTLHVDSTTGAAVEKDIQFDDICKVEEYYNWMTADTSSFSKFIRDTCNRIRNEF